MEVKNLQWVNSEHTMIDMEINHPQFGWIPFTANLNDIEESGRALYAEAVSGAFGLIAEYVPPPPPPEPIPEPITEGAQTL